jgi:hypothetical protein
MSHESADLAQTIEKLNSSSATDTASVTLAACLQTDRKRAQISFHLSIIPLDMRKEPPRLCAWTEKPTVVLENDMGWRFSSDIYNMSLFQNDTV